MRTYEPTARYDDDLNNWVRKEEETYLVGLTDFGQAFIGAITAISDLPSIGQLVVKGAMYALLESDKATTEINLPIGGQIVAINEQLLNTPALINTDCYGAGWIVKLKDTSSQDWEDLQSAEDYVVAVSSFFNK